MRYTYFPKQESKFTHPEKKEVKRKEKEVKKGRNSGENKWENFGEKGEKR